MKKFVEAIKDYIEERMKNDSALAEKVAAKNNDYEGCAKYIIAEVKKMKVEVLADEEVFGMAVHFFDEDIKAPKDSANCRVVVSKHLTEEDKEHLREEAADAAREEYMRQEKAKELERLRKAEERAKEAAEKKRKEAEARLKEEGGCLFNFDDDEKE